MRQVIHKKSDLITIFVHLFLLSIILLVALSGCSVSNPTGSAVSSQQISGRTESVTVGTAAAVSEETSGMSSSGKPSVTPADTLVTVPAGTEGSEGSEGSDGSAGSTGSSSSAGITPDNKYTLVLTLDMVNNSIGGTETVTVKNSSEDTWNELCFRDYPSLFTPDGGSGYDCDGAVTALGDIEDLTNNSSLSFFRDPKDISVVYMPLSVPIKAGESRTIKFNFTAYVPELAGRYGYYNDVYNLANFYPVLAVYENSGWVTEKYFLRGECFYSIVSDYEAAISVPDDCKVISSGISQKKAISGKNAVWHIKADNIRDFALVIGSDFEVVSDSVEGITVNSYFMYGDESRGETMLNAGTAAVEAFNKKYGKYPYSEFDIVETYLDAGGMEYPNLVMISSNLGNYSARDSYLSIVVAHETAHQWFYGLVGDNQYTEAWLDESFASFSEIIYKETFTDAAEIERQADTLEESLESEGIPLTAEDYYINLPYSEFDSDQAYTYSVYDRGELFLYRLREAMGSYTFDMAIKEYVADYSFKVADTADFEAVIRKYADGNPEAAALLSKYLRQDT